MPTATNIKSLCKRGILTDRSELVIPYALSAVRGSDKGQARKQRRARFDRTDLWLHLINSACDANLILYAG